MCATSTIFSAWSKGGNLNNCITFHRQVFVIPRQYFQPDVKGEIFQMQGQYTNLNNCITFHRQVFVIPWQYFQPDVKVFFSDALPLLGGGGIYKKPLYKVWEVWEGGAQEEDEHWGEGGDVDQRSTHCYYKIPQCFFTLFSHFFLFSFYVLWLCFLLKQSQKT